MRSLRKFWVNLYRRTPLSVCFMVILAVLLVRRLRVTRTVAVIRELWYSSWYRVEVYHRGRACLLMAAIGSERREGMLVPPMPAKGRQGVRACLLWAVGGGERKGRARENAARVFVRVASPLYGFMRHHITGRRRVIGKRNFKENSKKIECVLDCNIAYFLRKNWCKQVFPLFFFCVVIDSVPVRRICCKTFLPPLFVFCRQRVERVVLGRSLCPGVNTRGWRFSAP